MGAPVATAMRNVLLLIISLTALPVACVLSRPAGACEMPRHGIHSAVGIVDGRTLRLDDRSELLLAAILPPTRYDNPAQPAEWPPERAAREALTRLAKGRTLHIARETPTPDRYSRWPAQAEFVPAAASPVARVTPTDPTPLAADRWLQARLIANGHARVALTPETPSDCAETLLHLEAIAEIAHRGLWREAVYQPKPAANPRALLAYRSTFQIVSGTVRRVEIRKNAVYLNFGDDWRRDFTARIARRDLGKANTQPEALARLENQPVRIRGWIERRRGPLINIWRLEQIERLEARATGAPRRLIPPRLATTLTRTSPAIIPAAATPHRTTGRKEKAPTLQ